jgi:hypothetical protein
MLCPGQLDLVLGAEQVSAAGRAVQQRAAGEDRDGRAVAGVFQGIRQVRERVAGGGERPQPQLAGLDHVAVSDRGPPERHLIGRVHVIGGAGGAGQRVAAGDIVIVQVGLENVRDLRAALGGKPEHPVEVPLRVDDQRCLAVRHQVAAVSQGLRLDRANLDHRLDLPCRVAQCKSRAA